MNFHAHLADLVLNRPLLITPDKAQVILSVLANRIGVDSSEMSRFTGDSIVADENGRLRELPYQRTPDGVAIITIVGSLINRGAWVGANSGKTSYEGVKHQIAQAVADPKVHSIILDLHSPGGEAVGAFEAAAAVRAASAVKHVVAVVNGMAASAAYAIASGATEIVTTETGVSGSIGVVLLHADFSGALQKEGIKATLIFAGDHKADANPFEALPDAVREDMQAEVNGFYEQFLATVATGRGTRLTKDMARATQARTKIGQDAVTAGLADRVGTFESVLAELSRKPSARGLVNSKTGALMSNEPGATAAEQTVTKADHDAAVAKASADATAAAMARNTAIMSADGIKGNAARLTAALDLAAKSPGMSAPDIVGFVTANITDVPATVADRADLDARGAKNPVNGISGDHPAPKVSRLATLANQKFGATQ